MKTLIINDQDEDGIKEAALALKNGELVAFPTETVYGLGANALNPQAVKRIFEVKGRPSDNPLIVHISKVLQINDLVREIPINAKALIKAFWPGPLTLVFKKSNLVPDIITAGLDTVAIRMPENNTALRLIDQAQVPVAAPSANLSGRPSPTKANHVYEDLSGKIRYIIDGGSCKVGVESTVLDVTTQTPVILRPGGITKELLETILERVKTDPGLEIGNNAKPRSPGMKYRHYSPKAEMVLIKGKSDHVVNMINDLVDKKQGEGLKVGVLTTNENSEKYRADIVLPAGSISKPADIASTLYDTLRKFDESGVDIIYSEAFSESGIGHAIMNRLKKAAAGKIIEV